MPRDSVGKCLFPFLCDGMRALIANLSFGRIVAIPGVDVVEVLKMRGRKLESRCLHFVLPLAALGLDRNLSSKHAISVSFAE